MQIEQMRKRNREIIQVRPLHFLAASLSSMLLLAFSFFFQQHSTTFYFSCYPYFVFIFALLSFMFVCTQNGVCYFWLASSSGYPMDFKLSAFAGAPTIRRFRVIWIGEAVGLSGRLHISCKNQTMFQMLLFRTQSSYPTSTLIIVYSYTLWSSNNVDGVLYFGNFALANVKII